MHQVNPHDWQVISWWQVTSFTVASGQFGAPGHVSQGVHVSVQVVSGQVTPHVATQVGVPGQVCAQVAWQVAAHVSP
jgi:hypothetical protein